MPVVLFCGEKKKEDSDDDEQVVRIGEVLLSSKKRLLLKLIRRTQTNRNHIMVGLFLQNSYLFFVSSR